MTRPDDDRGAGQEQLGPGWAAPVMYLSDYPEVDISPRGQPYYVCGLCDGPLQVLPRSSSAGVMLVCVYSCGQRFWIDDEQ
jgi:hypothetical protein